VTGLAAGALSVLAFILAFNEGMARAGAGLLRWLGHRTRGPLEGLGAGVLLGTVCLGTGLLGLALNGLFFPPLVVAASLLLVASSPRDLVRAGSRIADAARAALPVGWVGGAVIALSAIPVFFPLLVPVMDQDCYVYHLGAPWMFLGSHRALFDQVPLMFHLSLPFETAFALPLALGDDRFARAMTASCFMGAGAVFAQWRLDSGDRTGAWLGLVVPFAAAHVPLLAADAKNDAAAAACFVAGAVMSLRGGWSAAAPLLGAAVAAKAVHAPVVVAWVLFTRPRAARVPLLAALALLPGLAWWSKAWLDTGTPFFPFTGKVFSTHLWDAGSQAAFMSYWSESWEKDTMQMADLPVAWFRHVAGSFPLALLAVPGLLLPAIPAPVKFAAAGLALSQFATLGAGHTVRFLMPSAWMLVLLAAAEVRRLPVLQRRAILLIIPASILARVWFFPSVYRPPWRHIVTPVARVLEERLTTYGDAVRDLRAMGATRVLTVGELMVYRLPGRPVFGGVAGERQVVWQAAREGRTPAELSRRFRQLGVRTVLYNFTGAKWVRRRSELYSWDERMGDLYSLFVRSFLTVSGPTRRVDFLNGGYVIYAVEGRPRARPDTEVYFLPGAEAVCQEAIQLRNSGDTASAAVELERLAKRYPEAGFLRGELAYCRMMERNWGEAYRLLKPIVARGWMDSVNYPNFGTAALNVGKTDEAEKVLRECLVKYPGFEGEMRINLANVYLSRALVHAMAREGAKAEDLLKEAASLLEFAPSTAFLAAARRARLSGVKGLQGDLAFARGEYAVARSLYGEAAALARGTQGAETWTTRERAAAAAAGNPVAGPDAPASGGGPASGAVP